MTTEVVTGVVTPSRKPSAFSSWWSALLGPTGFLSLFTIVVLGVLVLPPMVILVQNSLSVINVDGSAGAFTWLHYQKVFSDPKLYMSTWNSVTYAAFTTIFALLVGGMLAWIVERTNAPCKALAYLTAIVSLGMPLIMSVLAWIYLLGRAGPFNDLYRYVTGSTDAIVNPHTMSSMVLVGTLAWLPLVFLLCSAAFRASNAEMEEAARMSGATLPAMIWRVSLKLAKPAILATALFVFIRSLEAFDIPVILGRPGGINLLTTEIYFAIRAVPPDIGYSSAFAVLLTIIIAILMYFYSRIAKNAEKYATVTGKGYRPRPLDLGWGRWLGGGFIVTYFIAVLGLPLMALVWVSFMPFVRSMRWSGLSVLTTSNYETVFKQAGYLRLVLNTLFMSSFAATVTMALMLLAGWLVARRKPGGVIVDQLTTMPLMLPGIVIGVAMMELALNTPFGLYNTVWILIIAFIVRYMPFGMRYAFSGVLQIHRELEEAANVSGAGTLTTLRKVVAPLLLPALASGWLFVFLNASNELSLPVLLAGPNSQTMSVAIFEQSINGQFSELAALGLLWTGLMTVFAVIFYVLVRRQSSDTFGK